MSRFIKIANTEGTSIQVKLESISVIAHRKDDTALVQAGAYEIIVHKETALKLEKELGITA
ncbi:hypothetical protein D3C75_512080 [compost metagenome]